jgi:hypothetical protein
LPRMAKVEELMVGSRRDVDVAILRSGHPQRKMVAGS